MVIDPWSVSPEALDALAGQLFAASLIPYIAFLYFLNSEKVDCPKLANFGFRFLLVFVFATIPAGIYAKVHYHDILANIDWLHGGAESLLTITNLLIVLGFRNAIQGYEAEKKVVAKEGSMKLNSMGMPLLLCGGLSFMSMCSLHMEPANALSFPTWVIHVSSLIEWLVAMGLVWKYSEVCQNERWKGLTWGMLPLHTSGICACTFHLFYNAASLNSLVALQAGLTLFGNVTMAVATYRIFSAAGEPEKKYKSYESKALVGFEDLGENLEGDSNILFFLKVFGLSALGSAVVKWGSLYLDAPFDASLAVALSIIAVPTALNMAKWAVRSQSKSSDFGGFL